MTEAGEIVMTNLQLSTDTFPNDTEINCVISNRAETILLRPLNRYLEVVQLYPYNPDIDEFKEIDEAAAVGDGLALALHWAAMAYESYFVSGTHEPDSEADRQRAVRDWENYRQKWLRPIEREKHDPVPEEEAIDMLDESIAIIEGALAVSAIKSAAPKEQ